MKLTFTDVQLPESTYINNERALEIIVDIAWWCFGKGYNLTVFETKGYLQPMEEL